jgi:hypothetical protein
VCDAFYYEPSYPHITQDGNHILVVYFGQHWDPGELCTFPDQLVTTPLGTFEPGSYDVTVQLDYYDFFSQPQTLIMGDAPFVVTGAISAPIAASASNPISEALLVLLLFGLALFAIGRRTYGMVLVLAMAPYCHCSAAQIEPSMTVQFLVKNSPGAPTPAQVVSYYSVTPHVGPPPLHAFTIASPLTVQYLLPFRAAGDFLAW